jgi:type IV secretory pathway TrbD component
MPARCPECGAELAAQEPTAPVSYEHVEPRLFGVLPRVLVLVVALTLLVGGVVSLALREWPYGVVLIVLALPLLGLYAGEARRDPASAPMRLGARAYDRARGRANYAGTALRAWIEAGGKLTQLRLELARLRRERQRAIDALGMAAYRGDEREEVALRERLASLDGAIADGEQARREEIERARAEVASSRVPVNATRELSRR